MNFKIIALLFILALSVGSVFGQDAKVLTLSASDAQEAKAKYDTLQKAQKDWDDFKDHVSQVYVEKKKRLKGSSALSGTISSGPLSPGPLSACGETACWSDSFYKDGWENGFVFDSNFQFIVPKVYPSNGYISVNGSSTILSPCWTISSGSTLGSSSTSVTTPQGTIQ